jgi:hypothetical protein
MKDSLIKKILLIIGLTIVIGVASYYIRLSTIDPRCRIKPSPYIETGCINGPEFIEDSVVNNPVECLDISVNDCIGPRLYIVNNCGLPFTMNGVKFEEEITDISIDEGSYEYNGEINNEVFKITGRVVTPCD